MVESIQISETLRKTTPRLHLAALSFDVAVKPAGGELWRHIEKAEQAMRETHGLGDVKNIPPIASARAAYKACGKDPARYRLSAEALMRRILNGKSLYKVNNTVDYINLLSLSSGFSIGGYDAGKISGGITMGVGEAGEPYQAIGRGELNIAGMPVFRDGLGAFGSATSDSLRTMITESTQKALLVVVDFGGDAPQLAELLQQAQNLLPLAGGVGEMQLRHV